MNSVFYMFMAAAMLAPLLFGLVYSLFQAMFACVFFGLLAAYCIICLIQKKDFAVGLRRMWPECTGFILVFVWSVYQMLSVAPDSWHHPLWAEAAEALGQHIEGSISVARGDGFSSLMRLAMYAAVFWLAVQFGRDRYRARLLLGGVAVAATVYAIYGLVMHFGDYGMILWIETPGTGENVTGTFVNRNNFATYMGLGLLCASGFYLADFFRALLYDSTGRDKLLHLFQRLFVRGAPLLACIIIMLTALLLTHSRAGVICALLSLLLLGIFMGILGRIYTRSAQLMMTSLLVAIMAVFLVSGEGWLDRLTATDLEREGRLQRYEQTWRAIGHAPITGYGLGSFGNTFPVFADERTSNSVRAHNDWLEMMYELGIPAAIIWFGVIGGLGLRCLVGFFQRRRDHLYPLIGFCASILVGLHALVDFSLQIPAVAITFCVLLGVGVSQSKGKR